jgi:Putative peptidoglycan binding domain
MRITAWAGAWAALGLAACTQPAIPVAPPVTAPSFQAELVNSEPKAAEGECWHRMGRPALFETVTEQVLVTPEQRDAAGAITRPAVFRTETRQSELRARQQVWFRIPCRSAVDSESVFVASLQRALKARGLYGGAVTGTMDDATETAVLRYQAANGLESSVLSLAAAQALGLISVVR